MLSVKAITPEVIRRRALGKVYALLVHLADAETQTINPDVAADSATKATPGNAKEVFLSDHKNRSAVMPKKNRRK